MSVQGRGVGGVFNLEIRDVCSKAFIISAAKKLDHAIKRKFMARGYM